MFLYTSNVKRSVGAQWVWPWFNLKTLCAKGRRSKSPSGHLIQRKFSMKRKIRWFMGSLYHHGLKKKNVRIFIFFKRRMQVRILLIMGLPPLFTNFLNLYMILLQLWVQRKINLIKLNILSRIQIFQFLNTVHLSFLKRYRDRY